VAEWFKAAVLKTVVPQGTGGSNPSSSASFPRPPGDRLIAMTSLPDDAPDPEQMRRFSEMTPDERWAVARSLQRTARDVKHAGVRAEHPDWSDEAVLEEVRRQFLRA
jgi:hypothetical protein